MKTLSNLWYKALAKDWTDNQLFLIFLVFFAIPFTIAYFSTTH